VSIDSLKRITRSKADDTLKVRVLMEIDEYYRGLNELLAIRYGTEAIELARKTKNKELISDSYVHLIGYLVRKRNFIKAHHLGYEALDYFKNSKNKRYEAELYNILGSIAFHTKEFDKAIRYIQKSIDLTKREKRLDKENIAIYYSNLGNAYYQKEAYQSSIDQYHKTLRFVPNQTSDPIEREALLFSTWISMAGAYTELNQLDSANYYLEFSVPILLKDEVFDPVKIYYLSKLSLFELKNKNYTAAINATEKALVLDKKYPNFTLDNLLFLSHVYEKTGNPEKSLLYLKQYRQLSDSLNKKEKQEQEKVIAFNFKLEKGEQISQQKLMKHLLSEKKVSYQFRLFLLISIVLSLLLLLLINFFRYRTKHARIEKEQLELKHKNISLELEKSNIGITNNLLRLVNMNDFMLSVMKELETNKTLFKKEHFKIINSVSRRIKSNTDSGLWEEFEMRFNQVHQEFYMRICEGFPNLSQNERRLIIFLRLNLSSKEIAVITGQSLNSITVARVRLRTKLGITNSSVSLVEFVNRY
jgi:tetratricopeptide (TPR) repeat protein/DNA-binding CsgD family transcriptional regulator